MPKIRCAIYTRKSTEHGLELEFNSLQNQEEACKAYIASQSFNGWEYCKTYTDAAISGGTMARPALQQMLDDMSRGLINVVVVYKVDRLSRSILDFHSMMKYFEKYNANFVSITQSFDTSNSMGKLTLNMLLSFAQFEREVASERVRDKIRASKSKGMWLGGAPRLGYDLKDKKLIINEQEAEQIRDLFNAYLRLGSVSALIDYAADKNIFNKQWKSKRGAVWGGRELTKHSLHRILRDKIYIGMIESKVANICVPGEHQAIIDTETFNHVQEMLAKNGNDKTTRGGSPNLITGKLFNAAGVKFTNQRTCGAGKTTKYYYATRGFYLPAPELDTIVARAINDFMDSDMSNLGDGIATTLKRIDMHTMEYDARRKFICTMIRKVVYTENQIMIFINPSVGELQKYTGDTFNQNSKPMEYTTDADGVIIKCPVFLKKYSKTNSLLNIVDNNHLVVRAFATAFHYRDMYERGRSVPEIATDEHASETTVRRYLKLAYINPQIINDVLDAKTPYRVDDLFRISPMF